MEAFDFDDGADGAGLFESDFGEFAGVGDVAEDAVGLLGAVFGLDGEAGVWATWRVPTKRESMRLAAGLGEAGADRAPRHRLRCPCRIR